MVIWNVCGIVSSHVVRYYINSDEKTYGECSVFSNKPLKSFTEQQTQLSGIAIIMPENFNITTAVSSNAHREWNKKRDTDR